MTEPVIHIVRKAHDAPGFHYLFFDSDSIIQNIIHGYRNVEHKLPVQENTSFHALSITKTFTAVAIMQLVERHKLGLHDALTKYLPSFSFSRPISIRDLLAHQSGIANPLPLRWTHLAGSHSHFDYQAFSDSIILNNLKLKRTPGKRFAYSNLNYLVLGRLIEVLTGKAYRAYITENILNRLPTGDYIGFDIPASGHATGYHPNTWFQNMLLGMLMDKRTMLYKANLKWNGFNPFYVNGAAYGGLISAPRALMAFCRALLSENGPLISKPSVKEMLSVQPTKNGKNTDMCLGWFSGSIQGVDYFGHAGGGGGYYAEIRLYPKAGLGSVIMTNSSGMKDDRILDRLDVQYLRGL